MTAAPQGPDEDPLAAAAQSQLAALVNSSTDAIVGATLTGAILSWNHGAETLYGYTSQEMIGQPLAMLVPATARTRWFACCRR